MKSNQWKAEEKTSNRTNSTTMNMTTTIMINMEVVIIIKKAKMITMLQVITKQHIIKDMKITKTLIINRMIRKKKKWDLEAKKQRERNNLLKTLKQRIKNRIHLKIETIQ